MTKENVWAYPNPVRPDYTGAITITGLANSANVKIVTSNGTLVNEGIANNGQYKWYGLDQSGRRVASGVYMVEIATAEGEKGVVCKIAIVR
jgi:flagellar hook assembly protein FlgD